MRLLLATLFSVLILAGCQSLGSPGYRIDEQATAQAQWKPGEVVAEGEVYLDLPIVLDNYYRKFIGITNQGYAVVQDFYAESGKKLTDPYVVMQPDRIGDIGLLWEGIIKNSSTLLDGKLTLWYENGQKKNDGFFQDGKKQGLWTWWHENGQKEYEGNYQDGNRQGLWTWWHVNGQKDIEGHYQDGKMQGLWTWWYKNGQKWYEGHYQDDKPHGLWIYWYVYGQKEYEGNYQDGKEQGLWTEWHVNGKKMSEKLYESGEVVNVTYY